MTNKTVKLRLTAESGQLVGEVRKSRRAVDDLTEATGRAGTASRSGASDLGRFGSAAERVSRDNLSGLIREITRFGQLAGTAARRAASDLGLFGSTAERVSRENLGGLNREVSRFGQLAAGVFSFELLRRSVQLADSYANIQSRLGLATGSQERYAAAQQLVFDVSQRTYTSLDSTATLYGRMQSAADALGRSQASAVRVTELVNKSFQISGTEAGAANAAIVQLAQGLDAGALRGDEFNSVMEQAPRLATALAKGLGVGRGELRAMAEQGKLTADAVIRALESQGAAIDAEFAKLPLTAARGWQQLENVVLRTLGQINQQHGVTQGIAQGLQQLAEIIERVPAALDVWVGALSRVADESSSVATEVGGIGAGWQAVVEFLTGPALDELMILPVSIGTMIAVAIGEFDKLRLSAGEQFDLLLIGGQRAWYALEEGATLAGQNMQRVIAQAIDSILRRYAGLISAIAAAADSTGLDGVGAKLRDTAAAVLAYADSETAAAEKINATQAHYRVMNDALTLQEQLVKGVAQTRREAADSAIRDAMSERDAALKKLQTEQQVVKASEATTRAQARAGAAVKETDKKVREASAGLRAYSEVSQEAQKSVEQLGAMADRLGTQNEALRGKLAGLTDQQIDHNATLKEAAALYARNLELGPPTAEAQAAYARALSQANENLQLRNKYEAQNDSGMDRRRSGYGQLANAATNYGQAAAQAATAVLNEWEQMWQSGERRASAYWKAMLDMIKRAVTAMLFEWGKTKIIGLFTGNTSGGTDWAGMLASAFGMSGDGGSGAGGAIGQIGMDYVTGSTGGGFSGQFSGTTAGQYAPWLGAIAGAYMGSQRGDGGIGTVGSTVAYAGLGYTVGSLALSAAATVSAAAAAAAAAATTAAGAAGVAAAGAASTAAAGAGTAAAVGAGGTAVSGAALAIPIIGWVLAIIAAIDYASGGKVFGTKYRAERSTVSLGLSSQGGDATASIDEWKYRRNILQFNRGGSLEAMRRFGEVNRRSREVEATPEMERAADELFDSIQQVMVDSARRIAIETPPMLDAALNTVVEYDKKGRVKATKYFVEIFGKLYEEATSELAVARLAAEAQIAVVSAATAGEASRIAESYRYDAEKLAMAAAFLVTAQADIARGQALLGRTATLTGTIQVVRELARAGEDLSATYARLLISTTAIKDAFGLAGVQLQLFGADLVKFGDAIAQEAGGDEAAQKLWERFFKAFYSQSELFQHQINQLKPELATGLAELGLDADTSMEEFKAAFEANLPTMSAAQVATWLKVGDLLATVTGLLDKVAESTEAQARAIEEEDKARRAARQSYAEFAAGINEQLLDISGNGMSAFQKTLARIGATAESNRRHLNDLARAAGLAGARVEDLTRVNALAAAQAAVAARQLKETTRDLVEQLYGRADLAAQAATAGSGLQSVADGIGAIQNATDQFRDSILIDSSLSPLNVKQQLDEALRQLRATGDESIGRRALALGREMRSTGGDYTDLVKLVTSLIRPRAEDSAGAGMVNAPAVAQPTLTPAQRMSMAQQVAQNIADLSGFSGESYAEVAESIGTSLSQLGSDLGLQGDALIAYLDSLKAESYGLDDLASVISREVDRIIAAIGGDQTLDIDEDEDGKPTGTVATLPNRPRPAKPGKAAIETSKESAVVVAVGDMASRVEAALMAIAQVTSGAGEATQVALRSVLEESRDTVRELRLLTETVAAGGGRTGRSLV